MQLQGNYQFLGCESKVGFKDPSKTYYNVLLLQDADTMRVNIDADLYTQFKKVAQLTHLVAYLDWNERYSNFKVARFEVVQK